MEEKVDVAAENASGLLDRNDNVAEDGEINASGHRQELLRNFNLLSICSVAITTGNTWVAIGGTIVNYL